MLQFRPPSQKQLYSSFTEIKCDASMLPLVCPGSRPGDCGTTLEFESSRSCFSSPKTCEPFNTTLLHSFSYKQPFEFAPFEFFPLLFFFRPDTTTFCLPLCFPSRGLSSPVGLEIALLSTNVCALILSRKLALFDTCEIQNILLSFLSISRVS